MYLKIKLFCHENSRNEDFGTCFENIYLGLNKIVFKNVSYDVGLIYNVIVEHYNGGCQEFDMLINNEIKNLWLAYFSYYIDTDFYKEYLSKLDDATQSISNLKDFYYYLRTRLTVGQLKTGVPVVLENPGLLIGFENVIRFNPNEDNHDSAYHSDKSRTPAVLHFNSGSGGIFEEWMSAFEDGIYNYLEKKGVLRDASYMHIYFAKNKILSKFIDYFFPQRNDTYWTRTHSWSFLVDIFNRDFTLGRFDQKLYIEIAQDEPNTVTLRTVLRIYVLSLRECHDYIIESSEIPFLEFVHSLNVTAINGSLFFDNSFQLTDNTENNIFIEHLKKRDKFIPQSFFFPTSSVLNESEKIDICKALRQKNAAGLTPLHAAVLSGNYNHIFRLLEMGADISIKDNYGKTAADYAVERGGEIFDTFFKASWEVVHPGVTRLGKLFLWYGQQAPVRELCNDSYLVENKEIPSLCSLMLLALFCRDNIALIKVTDQVKMINCGALSFGSKVSIMHDDLTKRLIWFILVGKKFVEERKQRFESLQSDWGVSVVDFKKEIEVHVQCKKRQHESISPFYIPTKATVSVKYSLFKLKDKQGKLYQFPDMLGKKSQLADYIQQYDVPIFEPKSARIMYFDKELRLVDSDMQPCKLTESITDYTFGQVLVQPRKDCDGSIRLQ